MRIKPRQMVPRVDLPLVGGGHFALGAPQPDKMTVIVFYRGPALQTLQPVPQ